MPRLTSPTGIVVNVSDDKAEQLRAVGYVASDSAKTPAKKAASSKTDSK